MYEDIVRTNQSRERLRDEEKRAEKREEESRQNRGFAQVYDQGWNRLDWLIERNPTAARLYMTIARHMDGVGAIVATQDILAEILQCSVKTIQRQSKMLEDCKALVRIPLSGNVYAYCLNPEEVWKAYNSNKEHAAFWTKTLVNTKAPISGSIKRRLTMMIREQRGEPELPLEDQEFEE